jgi:uncharacterized membrane protein
VIENFCKKVEEIISAPIALVAAIIVQVVWIVVGTVTRMDPFPFVFLLTISNVIQLILIFVLAVAQKRGHEAHEDRHEDLKQHISDTHAQTVHAWMRGAPFRQADPPVIEPPQSMENRLAC